MPIVANSPAATNAAPPHPRLRPNMSEPPRCLVRYAPSTLRPLTAAIRCRPADAASVRQEVGAVLADGVGKLAGGPLRGEVIDGDAAIPASLLDLGPGLGGVRPAQAALLQ